MENALSFMGNHENTVRAPVFPKFIDRTDHETNCPCTFLEIKVQNLLGINTLSNYSGVVK